MQLEFDNDRSGGFEPLRHFPSSKFVVLGLITTKHGQVSIENVNFILSADI